MANDFEHLLDSVEHYAERKWQETLLHPVQRGAELVLAGAALAITGAVVDRVASRRHARRRAESDAPYYQEAYGDRIRARDEEAARSRGET